MVKGLARLNSARWGRIQNVPSPSGDRAANDAAIVRVLIEKRAQRVARAFHVAGHRENPLALGGQRHAIRQPIEQAQPELVFEPLNAAHDGRGACLGGGRGLAEAQSVGDRHEQLKVVPGDAIDQGRPDGLLYFCNRPLRNLAHSTAPVPAYTNTLFAAQGRIWP